MFVIKKTKQFFRKYEQYFVFITIFLLILFSVFNSLKKTTFLSGFSVGLLLLFLFPLSPKTRFISVCLLSFVSPLFRIFGNFSFYTILLAEFNVISLVDLLLKKQLHFSDIVKMLIPIFLFLCACLFSFIGSSITLSNFTSLVQFFLYTSISVWYFVFRKLGIVQSRDLGWLLISFALSTLVMVPVYFSSSYGKALFAYFGYPDNTLVFNKNFFGVNIRGIRFSGCMVDPNYYGFASLFFTLICFGKFLLQGEKKALWGLATMFFLLCGCLSLSTSYFIDFFLFFFIFFVYRTSIFLKKVDYRRSFAVLFIIAITSAIIIYQFVSLAFNYPKDFTLRLFLNSFSSHRTELFRLGILQFFSSPKYFLLGSGWGNFLLVYDSDFSAHNSIVEALNTVGLLGFASFLYMHVAFYSISNLRFSPKENKILCSLIFAIILLSLQSIPAFGSTQFSLCFLLLIEFVPNNLPIKPQQGKAELTYAT
jgi:hypothetical protein